MGITYAQAITKAKNEVKLQDLGIVGLKIKKTATGARILEVPGERNGEKADLLAAKMRSVLGEMANVSRPTKCVALRISDLDDSVDSEEITAAVAAKGGCPSEQIKVGAIRAGPGGLGIVLVRCPIVAAKTISESGRLLVGWTSARVRVLDAPPMRCYKCMGIGHVRAMCPSDKDRSGICFRCAEVGHKAAECDAKPKCAICSEAKVPAGHTMGGRNCSPPIMKGKKAHETRAPPNAAESADALEEVEMSS